MELTKQPETEMEYWQAIEGLGGFAWRMNHDLGDGRIEDPDGRIDKEIQEATKISRRLVYELKEKFGVIPLEEYPKVEAGQKLPPAPADKKYYRDWYDEIKRRYYELEYEKIICSACPFTKGVEEMIQLGGQIPCGKINGWINSLTRPFDCGFIRCGEMTLEEFYQEIINKGGEVALTRFKIKEAGLKALTVGEEVKA